MKQKYRMTCAKCNGRGTVQRRITIRRKLADVLTVKCKKCRGTGYTIIELELVKE